jgi:hypothetical protein
MRVFIVLPFAFDSNRAALTKEADHDKHAVHGSKASPRMARPLTVRSRAGKTLQQKK